MTEPIKISSSELSKMIEGVYPLMLDYARKRFPSISSEIIQDSISQTFSQLIMKKDVIFNVLEKDSDEQTKEDLNKRFTNYALRSFLNRIISEIRRSNLPKPISQYEYQITDQIEKENQIELDIQRREKVLARAMDMLSEHSRQLLTLFYFEKLTMEEIADKLNYSSAQTARQVKYRAIQQLRNIVRNLEEEVSNE